MRRTRVVLAAAAVVVAMLVAFSAPAMANDGRNNHNGNNNHHNGNNNHPGWNSWNPWGHYDNYYDNYLNNSFVDFDECFYVFGWWGELVLVCEIDD